LLERFPSGTNEVGHPAVPLYWRIIEPADYGLTLSLSNQVSAGRTNHEFSFRFRLPKEGLPPARPALGTVFLIHGYGVDGDALFPWGLYLAEAGWRTVMMDLRGHGSSGGRRVTFGVLETNDLRCLKESLERSGRIAGPYVALGHSLGASLAVRWQAVDPSIRASVALGAYAGFENAVVRLRDGYARWVPRAWARGAAQRLPGLLGVEKEALDTDAAMRGRSLTVFFVAGWGDVVTPPEDSGELRNLAGGGSGFLIVAPASHEMLPYLFPDHGRPVVDWLAAGPWCLSAGSVVAAEARESGGGNSR
jgi:pimeloyl-ACP methyl ester carboxylesterase